MVTFKILTREGKLEGQHHTPYRGGCEVVQCGVILFPCFSEVLIFVYPKKY